MCLRLQRIVHVLKRQDFTVSCPALYAAFIITGESLIHCLCCLQRGHDFVHCGYEDDHASIRAVFEGRWLLKHSKIFRSYFKMSRMLTNIYVFVCTCKYIYVYYPCTCHCSLLIQNYAHETNFCNTTCSFRIKLQHK
jgi:hypothetical protein